MTARTAKNPRIARPVIALPLRRNSSLRLPATGAVASVATSSVSVRTDVSTAMSALLPGARVERGVDEVRDDVRDQHGQGDHEEAALLERVVVVGRRAVEQ